MLLKTPANTVLLFTSLLIFYLQSNLQMTRLLFILFITISLSCFSQERALLFVDVDTPPEFPGGSAAFNHYIKGHLRYPEKAMQSGIEGRVFVEYTVEKDGKLSGIRALKGIGYGCDLEAIRIFEGIPNFLPGFKGSEAVRVKQIYPVTFSLNPGNPYKKPPKPAYSYRPPASNLEQVLDDSSITELAMEFKKLEQVDERIGSATQLSYLNLTGNQLKELPEEIGELVNLETIFLTFNQLKALPESFTRLKSLKTIYLDKNKIDRFPDQMFELEKLEMIDISNTNIVELPLRIADMPNLKTIYARGTTISSDQIERIRTINPAIKVLQ